MAKHQWRGHRAGNQPRNGRRVEAAKTKKKKRRKQLPSPPPAISCVASCAGKACGAVDGCGGTGVGACGVCHECPGGSCVSRPNGTTCGECLQCQSGACVPCSATGQPCPEGVCGACGGSGQTCCTGGTCQGGLSCKVDFTCGVCGGSFQSCCNEHTCQVGRCRDDLLCSPCGAPEGEARCYPRSWGAGLQCCATGPHICVENLDNCA